MERSPKSVTRLIASTRCRQRPDVRRGAVNAAARRVLRRPVRCRYSATAPAIVRQQLRHHLGRSIGGRARRYSTDPVPQIPPNVEMDRPRQEQRCPIRRNRGHVDAASVPDEFRRSAVDRHPFQRSGFEIQPPVIEPAAVGRPGRRPSAHHLTQPLPSGRTAHNAALPASDLTKAIRSPRGDQTGTPTATAGIRFERDRTCAGAVGRAIQRFVCPPVSDTKTTSRSSGLTDGTCT